MATNNPYWIPGWTAQNMAYGDPVPGVPVGAELPDSVRIVTVTGTYVDLAGKTYSSMVSFVVTGVAEDPTTGTFLLPARFRYWLKKGKLEAKLPAGFTYQVTEGMPGGRKYSITLPANATDPVDMSVLVPANPA